MGEKTDPYAEISDEGSNEGDYEKGGYDSSLVSKHDISRYPPSKYPSSDNKPRRPKVEDSVEERSDSGQKSSAEPKLEEARREEAGWIHPNGEVEYIPNYVMGDHEKDAYAKLNPGKTLGYAKGAGAKAFSKYLKQGHIRFITCAREVAIMLDTLPTESQMKSIGKMRREASLFYFTFVSGDDGESWKEFIEIVSIYRETGSASIEESLAAHAERELKLAGLFDKDSDYEGMLGEAVLELMEVFAKQGHSGFSAMLAMDLFGRLAKFEALTELTDNPEEWNDISEYQDGEPGWQSVRSPSCFSKDGGKTYYNLDDLEVEHVDENGVSYLTYDGKKIMYNSKSHTI
jgi:hypothetical protein